MSKSYKHPLELIQEYLDKTPFEFNRKIIYALNFTEDELNYNQLVNDEVSEKGYILSFIESISVNETFLNVIDYYLPFLPNDDILLSISPENSLSLGKIIEDYNPSVKYIFYSDFRNLYANGIQNSQDIANFLDQLPKYNDKNLSEGEVLFSPKTFDSEESFPLDEETQNIINEISNQLQNLNNTGQFLNLLPLIEKQLQHYKSKMNFPVSDLQIDQKYRIYLKDYNNKEVKLSHLSKSIYFLFLINREIHLNEFPDYKAELLTIYKHVSNQENLAKMQRTIDNLVLNENKELYVHFARIKSAFCGVIADDFAKNYYIRGDKYKPKKIVLDPSKSNIKELELEFFPTENLSESIKKHFDGIF